MSSAAALATRQALAAPAIPTVCTDASGARIRTVGVHLTEFAPGCRGKRLQHPDRWRTFYGVTPAKMLRTVLRKLQLPPGALTVAGHVNGDVDLLIQVKPEDLRLVSTEADRVERAPIAVFWDGLTEAEVQGALDQLAAAGWTPPAPITELPEAP